MFERLQDEVDQYNEKHASMGEKALLQWYDNKDVDSENECIPINKEQNRDIK